MEDEIKNIDVLVNHWRESSEQNYATMLNLIKTKEFSWALFLGSFSNRKTPKSIIYQDFT